MKYVKLNKCNSVRAASGWLVKINAPP